MFEPQEKSSITTHLQLSWSQNPALLPAPKLSMQGNPVPIKDGFERIIGAFENVSYMGELRQRWVEIKKLLKGGLKDDIPAAMKTKESTLLA